MPVARDDGPPNAGTPDFVLSRQDWLAAGYGGPTDASAPGGHGARGSHHEVTSAQRRGPGRELDFAHTDGGGHLPGSIPPGAGGPANAGLRGDNSLPHANRAGYPLGLRYLPQVMQRAMGTGRMRGALRAIGEWQPETGSASSPPPAPADRTSRTSPFDPAAKRAGFGPVPTRLRHILRPAGDEPIDVPPRAATTGDGLML